MPVEIKELVIRAVVERTDGNSSPTQPPTEPEATPVADQAIVEASVREVLRILRSTGER